MSLIPDAIEIHTATKGSYYVTSSINEPCSAFTLITNSQDFEKEVTNYILKYAMWHDSEINLLLINLNEDFQFYETISLKVLIHLIEQDYPHPAPEGTLDLNPKRRVINFYDFMMKAIEKEALVNEKKMRKNENTIIH